MSPVLSVVWQAAIPMTESDPSTVAIDGWVSLLDASGGGIESREHGRLVTRGLRWDELNLICR